LDANVTSLSVRKFGDSEIVGHVGYQLYSALQLKGKFAVLLSA